MVGYRDHLTVTRVAGKTRFASESADKLIFNVTDVNIPDITSVTSADKTKILQSPSMGPCMFRVEFDCAGNAVFVVTIVIPQLN